MKRVIATGALFLLMLTPTLAQTPDGASKTPQGDKPTPQDTDKDRAEKESVKNAPDQKQLPHEGTKPPEPSTSTKEAK